MERNDLNNRSYTGVRVMTSTTVWNHVTPRVKGTVATEQLF